MTDQEPSSPFPPLAPGGMAPPPPPPPPGVFDQPTAPLPEYETSDTGPAEPQPQPEVEPPKRTRVGLIIGGVVALILLCALGACAIGVVAFNDSNSQKNTITLAEQHFTIAMNNVDSATISIKKASAGSQAEVKAAITDANEKLRQGRDEIAKATAQAEQLKDSQGKTDYINGLKAATATFDALQDMVAYLDAANGMVGKAVQAAALTKEGNKAMNNAIAAGNASRYSAMRSFGVTASTDYTKAALLFREAHAIDPSAGLDKAAVYAEKRKLQADVVVRMADEGKAGRLSAYNSDIKKQAALAKQAEAAGTPAIVSDPNWAANRLEQISTKIDAAAKLADDMRSKALKELGFSQ